MFLEPILENPIKLRLPDAVAAGVGDTLTYEEKKVTLEWLKWKKIQTQDNTYLQNGMQGHRHWYFNRNTRESLDAKIKDLYNQRYKSLLFKDEKGYWTYSGFCKKLFGNTAIKRGYELPEFGNIPWEHKPDMEPRWYQTKSVDLLAPEDGSRNHGAVEIGTGLGKTFIMALLIKRIGLSTVIVVPTKSIAEQMLSDMTRFFGSLKVGQFFDSKKNSSKFITVAISKSLMNVVEGDEHYFNLIGKKVLLVDESHQVPAETLSKLAVNLLGDIPYRYFFSGTQIRQDGLELLLDGIIGDVVLEMSVEEGVDQGFLSKPVFYQWETTSESKYDTDDVIEMNRRHLHSSSNVNKHAVKLIKAAVNKGRRVMVMLAEVDQFIYLKKAGILDLDIRFAHGESLKPEQKKEIPQNFHKSKNSDLVARFDKGEFPVLVATSCLTIGTDIRSVDCIVDLAGLTSEIAVRQRVGRGTRLFPGKENCVYNDYCVTNIDKMKRHAAKRRKIFNSIYGSCTVLEAK